jgi:hypothetical protein
MAPVVVSPVSFATSRASRQVSGSRMLIGIVLRSMQHLVVHGEQLQRRLRIRQ